MLQNFNIHLHRDDNWQGYPTDLLERLTDKVEAVFADGRILAYLYYAEPDETEGCAQEILTILHDDAFGNRKTLILAVQKWLGMHKEDRLLIMEYFNTCLVKLNGNSTPAAKVVTFCKVFVNELAGILVD